MNDGCLDVLVSLLLELVVLHLNDELDIDKEYR
jgi:hypothetical protein